MCLVCVTSRYSGLSKMREISRSQVQRKSSCAVGEERVLVQSSRPVGRSVGVGWEGTEEKENLGGVFDRLCHVALSPCAAVPLCYCVTVPLWWTGELCRWGPWDGAWTRTRTWTWTWGIRYGRSACMVGRVVWWTVLPFRPLFCSPLDD